MVKPLVSILIPAHNAEKTISAAIHSCLNQSYDTIEILVLDNASTDNTLGILESFSDHQIKTFSNKEKGIAVARNFLVSKAKGKYIAWLDADDISMPQRIELQTAFMENYPEIDVLGSYIRVRGSESLKSVKWPIGNSALHAWLSFRNPFVQSSLMIRSSAKPSYDTAFDYVEDYHWLVQNKDTLELQILPEYLCSYYQSDEEIKCKIKQHKQEEKLFTIWGDEFKSAEHLFKFLRSNIVDKVDDPFLEIKSHFNNSEDKQRKAILYYYMLRLYKLYPNLKVLSFCFRHLVFLPRALKIRPRFVR